MMKLVCDVAIVGCGLGGAAAALAIQRSGHQVTIYERAHSLAEIGAGIQLPYNCTRILKGWNILPLIESLSVRSSSVALRSYREGNILFKRTVPSPPPQGTPHLLIHRAEFLKVLFHEALKLGVVVRFDSIITGIDFTKPSLEVSGTGEVLYDVIFGADGQKSYCREIFLGRLDPPRFSKDLAYRIVIPLSECEGNEELSELLGNFDINCWMGPNAHVVCYQLKGALNIVMVGPDSHSAWADGRQVDLQEVDTVFEGWDPRLRMLRQLSKGVLRRHLLSSHEMDTWSHANGTFALLGDACHVATPHLAQGAAQALEDGAALGELFSRLEDKPQIKDILRIYETIRKPRTTSVIRRSDARRDVFQLPDGPAQEERDWQLLQEKPFDGYPACIDDAEFQSWLLSYDIKLEVEKAWEEYKRSS